MIVEFSIHGDRQLVEGNLDLGDGPVPAVGWQLSFDAAGFFRVHGVTAYYDQTDEQHLRLELAPVDAGRWHAEQAVEFFHAHAENGEMTAFSDVEWGDYCYCGLCSNEGDT